MTYKEYCNQEDPQKLPIGSVDLTINDIKTLYNNVDGTKLINFCYKDKHYEYRVERNGYILKAFNEKTNKYDRLSVFSFINNEWICTDPDRQQYGRKIRHKVYEFKELEFCFEGNVERHSDSTIINLDDYTSEKIESIINSYGYSQYNNEDSSLLNIVEDSPEDCDFLIAECIFEQESGLY